MDKRVIFAVAGSGKTSHIVDKLNLTDQVLIVTYTNNNVENLRMRIIKKFTYYPSNIKLLSYFSFIHSFCFKPFLVGKYRTKGLYYLPNANRFAKNDEKYVTSGNRLYSNRIAKFLEEKEVLTSVNERIEKYYKSFYIDEVQDFGGHDFNFLKSLAKANVNILMVGDFFQHTFDTSRDGIVNKTLHDDFVKYQKQFTGMGMTVDSTTLNKSHRCSPTITDFITTNIGINITSHRTDTVNIEIVENKTRAQELMKDDEVVKLFYWKHYNYNCYSRNWGDCKGEDRYNRVCVVLNDVTEKKFKVNALRELTPGTKNKLYVACSRAKSDLYFVSEKLLK